MVGHYDTNINNKITRKNRQIITTAVFNTLPAMFTNGMLREI